MDVMCGICAAMLLALCLSGCGETLQAGIEALPPALQEAALEGIQSWTASQWSLQDPIDEFFAAADARDAAAVRALFSPNVQLQDQDLDQMIQALFALYPGPTEDCLMRTPVGASKRLGWGERMTRVHNRVPVVCQGVSYYCSFSYTTKDETDAGNIGLTRVVFQTEKAAANAEFLDTLEIEDGLTVIADAPGDYETRRIGDLPYRFTPIDRTITREALLEFLQTEDRWEAFAEHFGPPNAESYAGVFYELVPEDGAPRYACLYTKDSGGVERADTLYVYDNREHQFLETLWESQSSPED